MGPASDYSGGPCTRESAIESRSLSAADGTAVEIDLSFAPADVGLAASASAVLCDGVAALSEADLVFPVGHPLAPLGGSISIFRHIGDPNVSVAIPAHRWNAGTMAGIPAAIARPILPREGLGDSAVVTYDGVVLTKLQANGVPLETLLSVAGEVLK